MATRGSELEKKANKVNIKMRVQLKALIEKVPTPMQVTNKGVIPQQSTVDYTGVIQGGKYIAFDAKQTKIKTRLDLNLIHQHQLEYLNMVQKLGGITFFMVWFYKLYKEEVFIVPVGLVNYYKWQSDRNSIPINQIEKHSFKVKITNYLEFLEDENFISKLYQDQLGN